MFVLIKREIKDHIIFFIASPILSAIFIVFMISMAYLFESDIFAAYTSGLSLQVIVLLAIVFFSLGFMQMRIDRIRGVSTFLSTQPSTRSRILFTKIITGILAILTFFVPVIIIGVSLLRLFIQPIPTHPGIFVEMLTVAILMAFACYCIGLQTGWTISRITSIIGGIFITCILFSLVLIRGFDLHGIVILVLFIIASLLRTWQKFMSTPL